MEKTVGLTSQQINDEVYPIYTYMSLVFIVLLATLYHYTLKTGKFSNFLNDKLVLVIGTLGRLSTRFLLLYGRSLLMMQLM